MTMRKTTVLGFVATINSVIVLFDEFGSTKFNGFAWRALTESPTWDEAVASVSYLKEMKGQVDDSNCFNCATLRDLLSQTVAKTS